MGLRCAAWSGQAGDDQLLADEDLVGRGAASVHLDDRLRGDVVAPRDGVERLSTLDDVDVGVRSGTTARVGVALLAERSRDAVSGRNRRSEGQAELDMVVLPESGGNAELEMDTHRSGASDEDATGAAADIFGGMKGPCATCWGTGLEGSRHGLLAAEVGAR